MTFYRFSLNIKLKNISSRGSRDVVELFPIVDVREDGQVNFREEGITQFFCLHVSMLSLHDFVHTWTRACSAVLVSIAWTIVSSCLKSQKAKEKRSKTIGCTVPETAWQPLLTIDRLYNHTRTKKKVYVRWGEVKWGEARRAHLTRQCRRGNWTGRRSPAAAGKHGQLGPRTARRATATLPQPSHHPSVTLHSQLVLDPGNRCLTVPVVWSYTTAAPPPRQGLSSTYRVWLESDGARRFQLSSHADSPSACSSDFFHP